MIRTIYTCDKCGKEQDTQDQMWYIGITLSSYHYGKSPIEGKQKLYCRLCTEELGLVPPTQHKEEKIPVKESPSLEDLIREIVRSELPL